MIDSHAGFFVVFLVILQVISVCEERSVEGLVWLDRRLFSVGLDSNVVEYDLATLQIKVNF